MGAPSIATSASAAGSHGPPIPRWIEHVFVWSVLATTAALTTRLVFAIEAPIQWLGVAAITIVGYVAADFTSGVFHWAFDRLGSRQTPIIGEAFIQPFRYHHVDPADMMNGDFINTNGKNSIAILPVLSLGWLIPVQGGAWGVVALAGLLSFVFGIWMTNQFHKWAHTPEPGLVIATLQRWHLVLTPEHHALHHRAPYLSHYCITTGWCNPALERLGIFRAAERVLVRLGVPLAD